MVHIKIAGSYVLQCMFNPQSILAIVSLATQKNVELQAISRPKRLVHSSLWPIIAGIVTVSMEQPSSHWWIRLQLLAVWVGKTPGKQTHPVPDFCSQVSWSDYLCTWATVACAEKLGCRQEMMLTVLHQDGEKKITHTTYQRYLHCRLDRLDSLDWGLNIHCNTLSSLGVC